MSVRSVLLTLLLGCACTTQAFSAMNFRVPPPSASSSLLLESSSTWTAPQIFSRNINPAGGIFQDWNNYHAMNANEFYNRSYVQDSTCTAVFVKVHGAEANTLYVAVDALAYTDASMGNGIMYGVRSRVTGDWTPALHRQYGVYGRAGTTGYNWGEAYMEGPALMAGVYGVADGLRGVAGPGTDDTDIPRYGIYGEAPVATNSWAGYFKGSARITDSLTIDNRIHCDLGGNVATNWGYTSGVDYIGLDASSNNSYSNGNGNYYGLKGVTSGTNDTAAPLQYGVYGHAGMPAYSWGADAKMYGVYGLADGSFRTADCYRYGVYGEAPVAENSWAGYFKGEVKVEGNVNNIGYGVSSSSMVVAGDAWTQGLWFEDANHTDNEAWSVRATLIGDGFGSFKNAFNISEGQSGYGMYLSTTGCLEVGSNYGNVLHFTRPDVRLIVDGNIDNAGYGIATSSITFADGTMLTSTSSLNGNSLLLAQNTWGEYQTFQKGIISSNAKISSLKLSDDTSTSGLVPDDYDWGFSRLNLLNGSYLCMHNEKYGYGVKLSSAGALEIGGYFSTAPDGRLQNPDTKLVVLGNMNNAGYGLTTSSITFTDGTVITSTAALSGSRGTQENPSTDFYFASDTYLHFDGTKVVLIVAGRQEASWPSSSNVTFAGQNITYGGQKVVWQ